MNATRVILKRNPAENTTHFGRTPRPMQTTQARGRLLRLMGLLCLPVLFCTLAHAANTGPQLSSFVSNAVYYAAISWHDQDSNLLTRVEVSVDSIAWYSDEDTVPLVSKERAGDFNRWLFQAHPDFFPALPKSFRLTSSRPRPEATAPAQSLNEDTPALISLTATNPNGAPNTYPRFITSLPEHGTLYDGLTLAKPITSLNSALTDPEFRVLYVPEENFHGAGHFSYKVKRGWTESSSRLVPLTVLPINDRPLATAGPVLTDEDVPVTFALSGFDADGDPLATTIVLPPAHGELYQVEEDGVTLGPRIQSVPAVVSNSSGLVHFIPAANFFLLPTADTVRYGVFDGKEFATRITVTIGIAPVDDPSVARPKVHVGDLANPIAFVLLDASDVDDGITARIVSFPARGQLYVGSVGEENLLTPQNNTFHRVDLHYLLDEPPNGGPVSHTFTYEIIDQNQNQILTVTDIIELRQTKFPPYPVGLPYEVNATVGVPVDIDLRALDPDTATVNLDATIVTAPQQGVLAWYNLVGTAFTINQYPFTLPPAFDAWKVRYTPTGAGEDFFEFTVADSDGLFFYDENGTNKIKITISVAPEGTPPPAPPEPNLEPNPAGSQTNVTAVVASTTEILLNGVDPDGDSSRLHFTLWEAPDRGSLAYYTGPAQAELITDYPFVIPASARGAGGWKILYVATEAGADVFEFFLRDEDGIPFTDGTGLIQAIAVHVDVAPNLESE